MNVLDKFKFEARGGCGCSNSDYRLQRTTCCRSFAVEDDELSDLYVDPNDLSKFVTLLYDPRSEEPPACPFCGASEWDMVEILDDSDIPQEWRWAACG
ncbi:MAG: hypothetical protein KDA44_12510 [Planctomycetales bacterium]|nr:hypothetical protein [Planctomycetales bacterium]